MFGMWQYDEICGSSCPHDVLADVGGAVDKLMYASRRSREGGI
jgi:hypothetical protein